jgi:glycosyltransferase involved in cell wall biosynthesis
MSRLRVAIVAPSLRILGGQAVAADQLVQEWRDDPAVEAWLVPINPIPPGVLRYGTRVKYVRTIVTEMTYLPLLVRELRRADVVHIFSASYASFLIAPLPAMAIAHALGKPVILNYHSGEAPDHLHRSAIARAALARVHRNVVQSSFLHEVFARFGLESVIIPNTIDFKRFPWRRREGFGPHILSTRNLEPIYNVGCTIRAFRLVQDRYPNATLTLVGSGCEEQSLRALTRELRLTGVTFTGRVPPTDVNRFYHAAHIFVQTPNIDNMPLSILEAFATGLPVVSTEAGGVPAILHHEIDGLVAPLNDHRAVAAHLCRLLEDQALAARLVHSAREGCQAFSWSTVREKWLEVYREAAMSVTPDLVDRTRTAAFTADSERVNAAAASTSTSPDGTRPELAS